MPKARRSADESNQPEDGCDQPDQERDERGLRRR